MSSKLSRRIAKSLFLFCLACLCAVHALAQYRWPNDQKTALETSDSRAEYEAEQLVSLSPEKIISILRDETGLLLQFKRILVRKAYQQGRILDPEDLTDDAVFRLLVEDANIRVIATREIEDRYYVRAKPSMEEMQRDCLLYGSPPPSADEQSVQGGLQKSDVTGDANVPRTQESAYWLKHEQSLYHPCPATPPLSAPTYPQSQPSYASQQNLQSGYSGPASSVPQPDVQPRTIPRSVPQDDPRRQLLSTQFQQPMGNYFGGMEGDMGQMQRIRPDDLPQLLSASQTLNAMGGSKSPFGSGAGTSIGGMGVSPLDSLGLGSSFLNSPSSDMMPGQPTSFPQQASLDTRQQQFGRADLRNLDQPQLRHRPNPYADVPSLYDLYSQYSRYSPVLQRFGEDVFRNGTGNSDQLPMDLPAGPEYVVGPGDGLKIDLWGSVSQRYQRLVDREGRLALPDVGSVQVAGRTLGDVQHTVQSLLRTQYRDVEADVSLARIRTVRVYVVGDVERPGAYDISSLSTPLNAVFVAGGPTSRGSLRLLRHYRGQQLVQQVDVYDLLLHGVQSNLQHLQPGDTVLVPPLVSQVTIEGMVRRPAIYELNGEKTLSEILELAGGVLPSGTLRHVDVERVVAHESRTMLRINIPETNNEVSVNKTLDDFAVQDGDKIKISPILPFADKTVYLDGHTFRPGKYAYHDGMKVTDLIKSYNDLLPEPYKRHAEIIRLAPPDYVPQILAFNLEDALAGKDQDLVLKPFDTVRVFSRFDFEDPPVVTVTGEVRDPGDHVTNGAIYLRDALYLAGGTTPDALLDDAQVFRKTEDGKLKVIDVNLSRALAGNEKDNILLESKDRIFIHRTLSKVDPATVKIEGEVARPGKYPLGQNMTAAELVRLAGGLKRGAYATSADLTRYVVQNGQKVLGERIDVPIGKVLAGEPDTDVRLHDGDVLSIRQLTGWSDVGATIKVEGEVVHPGTYGIREGERLSSIIARAGGFRPDSYPYGAVFQRVQVRELEQKNRAELIRQTQDQGPALKSVPTINQDDKLAQDAALLQWQSTLEKLQNTPPAGRMVIHISTKMKQWANTPADVQVRAGDVIHIPKKPSSVMVDGSVYNPTTVTFKPGKSAGWYLRQAGGPTNFANRKAIFVIRADGSVIGGKGGLFSGSVESAALQAGDMLLVPEKGFSTNSRWKNILQVAQIAYYAGISTQVARNF